MECTRCGSNNKEDEWNEYYEDEYKNIYCSKDCIAEEAIDYFKIKMVQLSE